MDANNNNKKRLICLPIDNSVNIVVEAMSNESYHSKPLAGRKPLGHH